MMRIHESGFIRGLGLPRVAGFALLVISGLLLNQAVAWSGEWADEGFPAWQAVGDDELNAARGGFVFSNGVQVDIGIRKAAFVNDMEQFRTSFNISERVRSKLHEGMEQLRTGVDISKEIRNSILSEANSVLQVGTGNTLNNLEVPGGSTFIQNTLDNQFLGHFTVVDVRIRNLDAAMRQLPVSAFPAIRDFAIPGIAP